MKSIHNGGLLWLLILLTTSCQPHPYKQGQSLYQIHCESCHMEDGSGLQGLIPSLATSSILTSQPDSLICLIINGIDVNPATGQSMPENKILNEVEITNLVNYLQDKYAFKARAIKVSETQVWTANCQ